MILKHRSRWGFLLGLFMAPIASALAQPANEFYKGKQIEMYLGSSVGGGYDQYGRLLGRHISRHIPGNPTIIAQNMPGAGGLRATRFLFNNAPTDGTTIGLIHSSMIDADIFHLKEPGFEVLKANWLGNIGNTCV